MSTICSECKSDVYNPGVVVVSAELKKGKIKEGPGFVVCHSHFDKIKDKVHSLDELAEGSIVLLDEVTGYVHNRGTLAWTQPIKRIKTLGYLSKSEVKTYFPNTHTLIF